MRLIIIISTPRTLLNNLYDKHGHDNTKEDMADENLDLS